MADLTVRTFDFKKVVMTFGVVTFSGFMSGTAISVKASGNAFEKDKGADGTVDRINTNATDYSVSATLKQTAPINAVLSAILATDQQSNSGVAPLTIVDLNGTTQFTAPQAWLVKNPDADFGDSLNGREWTIETGPAAYLLGGNS